MKPKAKTLQQKLGFLDSDLIKPKHDEIMYWLDQHIDQVAVKIIGSFKPNKKLIKDPTFKTFKTWEFPVKEIRHQYYSESFSIVGYIDFVLKIEVTCETEDEIYTYPFCRNLYEVKTEIKSVGELIRQINTYRQYCRELEDKFIIVCPDDTHKDILRTQGISFLKYNP